MHQKAIFNYFLNGFFLANRSLDIFLISIGFTLSLPVFLIQKQQNKALDYGQVVKATLKNTKRLILPGILLFILFTIVLMASFVLAAISLHPSKDQVTSFFQSIGKGWHPIFLIPIVLIAFLEFTSFFFSLEGNGLLSSVKKSIVVAFNNLKYISIIILISLISTITSFIPIETFLGPLVKMILSGYIALVLTASSLLYYQTVIYKS